MLAVFFFFSVYLMSKILNLSMWICVIRSTKAKNTRQKSKFGMNNTICASVFASEVIEYRRTCSSVNNGLNSRASF